MNTRSQSYVVSNHQIDKQAYINGCTNLELTFFEMCEPSLCIENPFHSHVENEQEVKVDGEYSYQIDKQNSVYAETGGGSHVHKDEHI